MVPFIFCVVKPIGVHPTFEEKRMTEFANDVKI